MKVTGLGITDLSRTVGRRAATGLIALCLAAPAYLHAQMKVLGVYDATDGGHAPMSIAGKPVLQAMAAKSGFTLDYGSDKSVLNDANLAKYDVLIVVNFFPFNIGGTAQAAIQKFVESGKGWVVVHSSGCENGTWPWFGSKVMGGVKFNHHDNLRQGTLLLEDRTHAITQNLPASITLKEEWYEFSADPRPNVKVLAKAGPTADAAYDKIDHPMIWYSPNVTKAVYISPGHDASDWANADYVLLIHDAILWAGPASTGLDASWKQGLLTQPLAGRSQLGRVWFQNENMLLQAGESGAGSGIRISPVNALGRGLQSIP